MATRNDGTKANAPTSTNAPNQTLYLTNLPSKLRKVDIRLSLYTLFSTYGPVLDVIAMPGAQMRGQAWIAFRDHQASTQAMRSLQGMDFFGRSMTITYAKGKSNAIAKLDGTYRMPSAVPGVNGVGSGQSNVTGTSLQQEVFGSGSQLPQLPAGLPTKPNTLSNGTSNVEEPKGVKRDREDDDDDDEVAMDEESDAPMDEDSDDD